MFGGLFFPVGEFPHCGWTPLLKEFTMLTFTEAQKQFIGLFGQTAHYHQYAGALYVHATGGYFKGRAENIKF